MARTFRASLLIVGALVAAGPAAAQFGSIFGDPPRPPSAVPGGREPRGYPQSQNYPPAQNYPQQQPQYDQGYERAPPPPGYSGYPQQRYPNPSYQQQPTDPGVPPQQQGTVAPGRPSPSAPANFESQPLPPPPGGAAAPARPTAPAAALPPGTAAPASPGAAAPPAGASAAAPPGAPPPSADDAVTVVPTQKVPNPTAVFSGLDKITGRITTFEVKMNETVQFGALRVRPRACYTRLPTDAPNTTGFVEVDEVTLQGEVKGLFRGWMFASSPGLHGVEHPIYDVWLSDCKGAQATAAVEQQPTAGTEVPPPEAPPTAPPAAQRGQSAPAPRVPTPRRAPQ